MKIKSIYLFSLSLLLLAGPGRAQSIWNDVAGDSSYSDPGNWVGNVAPAATGADIVIGTMQGGDNIVGIDTAGNVTVNSWTFAATLNGLVTPIQVLNDGSGQQMVITSAGGITNASSLQNEFDLVVNAGTDMTFSGGSAGLLFANALNVSSFQVTTSGTVTVAPGQNLIFDINSASSYGRIGSVAATGAIIQVVGDNYTAQAGDSFTLTSANFNGATMGELPILPEGLTWDTSNFISDGVLSVQAVPEPSTVLLVLGALALIAFKSGARIRSSFPRK